MANDYKEQKEANDPVVAIKENLGDAKSSLDDADQEEQSMMDNLGDEVAGIGGGNAQNNSGDDTAATQDDSTSDAVASETKVPVNIVSDTQAID